MISPRLDSSTVCAHELRQQSGASQASASSGGAPGERARSLRAAETARQDERTRDTRRQVEEPSSSARFLKRNKNLAR